MNKNRNAVSRMKRVEALKMAISSLAACGMDNTCGNLQKSLTEYEKK